MNVGIENYHPKNNQLSPYDWTISRDTDFDGLGDMNEFVKFCEKKGVDKIKNKEEFFPLLEEYKKVAKNQSLDPDKDKLDYEVVNDFSIDAIKDNFTPPGAKSQKDEDDYNPQSEVRYTSPEELKLSEMSEEDLKQGLEDIKRGVTDYTDAEEPIVTGWIKDEMAKRKSKPTDEMADFQKSLDDYAAKNKKGREDIPATYKR